MSKGEIGAKSVHPVNLQSDEVDPARWRQGTVVVSCCNSRSIPEFFELWPRTQLARNQAETTVNQWLESHLVQIHIKRVF